jgi:hypothetical protein
MSQMLDFTRRAFLVGTAVAATNSAVAQELGDRPVMRVSKDPNCGCCSGWIEHIQAAGFKTNVIEMSDLSPLKARLRVPKGLASCHTAELDGYVIEGHVPVAAIKRLLTERPRAIGLAVPGMPVGSPGMEVPGAPDELYEVVLFWPSGQRSYGRFLGSKEL